MKALRIVSNNPPLLNVVEVPTPAPGSKQVLVRVSAAGLNRADIFQLHGHYEVPKDAPADIPGLEFAGVVESRGAGVSAFVEGQRVFGLCGGGAHAQYIVSPEELLMPTPDNLSDTEAAAVPEAFITVHDALVTQASMRAGERVLIHAIGSGVGLAALQTVRAWNCVAFGTSRSKRKLEAVRNLKLGSARAPDRDAGLNFVLPAVFDEAILKRTDGKGVDIILDPIGAAYFDRNLKLLEERGRLVIIATLGGTTVDLPLSTLMRKRLRLVGTMLRNRSLEEKSAATRAFQRDVLPKFASAELTAVVDRCFPLAQAMDAYSYMQANENFGKIVLTVFDAPRH
ncbi:MAG TPA: NAD(P)H-quinone oxidoreductase [Candidatus Eremiobacteraceae bacterium]|nr:NAD(P)H-quinone oxidoreductase [Candidatus Eremiobacteraceae bacterium]